jgi:hypothetical protein
LQVTHSRRERFGFVVLEVHFALTRGTPWTWDRVCRVLSLECGLRHGLTNFAAKFQNRIFDLSQVRTFGLLDPVQKPVNRGFRLG